LMAIVDLATGQITGCEKGSKVWYHEKAHIEFNKREFGAKVNYWQYHFMMTAVFFGSLALLFNSLLLKVFVFLNALGMVSCYALEEIVCWVWGLKEWRKAQCLQ